MRRNLLVCPVGDLINNLVVLGSNDVTIVCSLLKSFYSGRDGSIVPLLISIENPGKKSIHSIRVKFVEIISLNGRRHEHDILTSSVKEINENTRENQLQTTCELNLPAGLAPTHIPNQNGQPDNVPSIGITYEFRLNIEMEGLIAPSLHVSVPIGIE